VFLSSSRPNSESNELLQKEIGSPILYRNGKLDTRIKSETSNRVPVQVNQRDLAVKFPSTGLQAHPLGSQLYLPIM